jgi:hypothetical protein
MAGYVTVSAFEAIARALTDAGVRFMVVGGLAIQAHGLDRATYDIDLVIQLEPDNVLRAFAALELAEYKPAVPIMAAEFADRESRERLLREKNMVVLNFWSDSHRATSLDVFVAEPFDFDTEFRLGLHDNSLFGLDLCFPRVETLLAMKRLAGRPKDQHDIVYLEALVARTLL